jgi:septum formation protein
MTDPALILASSSPRRAQILRSLGLDFRVVVPEVDEALLPGETGPVGAERLARVKAEAVAARETLPVVAADTLVLSEGEVLGKPVSDDDAVAMLRRLSGRSHEVVTGVCVRAGGRSFSGVERTTVRFAALSPAAIDRYVASGEPRDKAGAYHVDGRGAAFIESVEGSPSNVAGLPVRLLLRLAREAGLDLGVD